VSGLRTISYGGGVQSTALLVLAAQRKIDFTVALFCNVGDDSEHPATLDYVREVATPWAAEHGITVHELHRVKRDGSRETLGKDHVYLTRFNKPLRDAIPEAQDMLPLFDQSPDTDGCDSGHCWT